jgi:hypothetical protein
MKPDVVKDGSEEILLVARIARRIQADELARRRLLVALLALNQLVRSDQGEPARRVILESLQRNLPALDRVALGTVGSELALVDVGVAVGALRAHVFENHADVTLGAGHILVHAAQGIPGLIVIEVGIRSDRLPACVAVTIGTRNGDRPVGIGHLRFWSHTCADGA